MTHKTITHVGVVASGPEVKIRGWGGSQVTKPSPEFGLSRFKEQGLIWLTAVSSSEL